MNASIGKLLEEILPKERIKTSLLDRYAYASDASFYQLIPQAVVHPQDEKEIIALFQWVHKHHLPITFRAGGTSLSGQSLSDGILADLSRSWRTIEPMQNGLEVRVAPGATGGMVNAYLKKYQRKIGPDPSSIQAAMMGGILSNNASGMCCGVENNSYHTLRSLRLILPNGAAYTTAVNADYERFLQQEVRLSNTLLSCREEILSNISLFTKIRTKYKTKNTVGYSLNAFLDFEHPLDIMAHLMIGAEGTLGFIAEAVLQTLPDHPFKATALLYFANIQEACEAILPLKEAGAEALELMDRASLRSVENMQGIPAQVARLPEKAAALLCEFQSSQESELQSKIGHGIQVLESLALLEKAEFFRDTETQALLWKIRKGMFPSVGAVRKQGTTVVLEDVAFPLEHLAQAVLDLQELFKKHGYENGIIFGHAKDGNLHFVVTQAFQNTEDTLRYEKFIDEVVSLVVHRYQGTLKAEHGTGRNMAPFVETEWGAEAYEIMCRIKHVVDPANLINPGVIINQDPKAHLKHLKQLPVVETEVDKCIECGFCEHNCPSKDITLSPRRRIVLRRELAKSKAEGRNQEYQELLKAYQYQGIDTCAVDGLCATDCPVQINTGELVKRLRKENHSDFANRMAWLAAKHFTWTEKSLRLGLRFGAAINSFIGSENTRKSTWLLRKVIPGFPLWNNQLKPARKLPQTKDSSPQVIYFTTCISRCIGDVEELSVPELIIRLSERAGIHIHIPNEISGHCCGQAFSSKGFTKASQEITEKTIDLLWKVSKAGALPIVMDASSCTYTLLGAGASLQESYRLKWEKLKLLDSVDFAADWLLPRLKVQKLPKKVALHPVCSLTKMGNKHKLNQVAEACATEVLIPKHAGCCGMAGDRGFYFPELTATASAMEIQEIKNNDVASCYSSAKTCELSLQESSGLSFSSILYLLEEASR
ncbi:MAG: FAD-binding oxidoreductase [Cytophagaceae bacterium]|nr:FAD-binding oxidoreductase [Cytophagaceae bacterium]